MNKTITAATLLAVASTLLGACNGSPSKQPITGDHPAQAPVATTDTIRPDPAAQQSVPFVNDTKVGRTLGSSEPSPPESRSR